MQQLSATVKKEEQIRAINKLIIMMSHVISFAQGDEAALALLIDEDRGVAVAKIPDPKETATEFAVERAPQFGQNVVQFPSNGCKCQFGVLDRDSATKLCLKCGLNTVYNYTVFADTSEGRGILAGENPVIENYNMPSLESTVVPTAELTSLVQASQAVAAAFADVVAPEFLPMPTGVEFAPYSGEYECDEITA